jgi:peptidyl-prolyl cis-trans isomerase SurA
MYKNFKIILFVMVLLFSLSSFSFGEEYVDRVIAVVNDDVITLSELESTGRQYFNKIKANVPAGQLSSSLEKARGEVLNGLINKAIVKQKAAELSIIVEREEIDKALAQMLSRNNATIEQFRKKLATEDISESEYRKGLHDQILQSKLINFQVRSRIVIIEDDIKEYYQKEYTQEEGESGYYILQMGFTWQDSPTDSDSKEAVRKKAEVIRQRVIAGEGFNELAQANSDLPSAVDGGDIGLIKKDEMASYMRETVQSLNPGEISEIVETGNTFQFFKLLTIRDGDVIARAPYDDVKEEIRNILYREKMDMQYKEWIENLREEAYIKILL